MSQDPLSWHTQQIWRGNVNILGLEGFRTFLFYHMDAEENLIFPRLDQRVRATLMDQHNRFKTVLNSANWAQTIMTLLPDLRKHEQAEQVDFAHLLYRG